MFRNYYQKGCIPIFSSFGSSPLKIWDYKSENGCIQRIVDEELKCLVFELKGKNISTTYITCPKNKSESLGITLPICVLNWKNILDLFTFEITIKDNKNLHRRFRFSNFLNKPRIKPTFFAICPLKETPEGWKTLQFNLSKMTEKAFCSCYVETVRVQINANCRLKGIYFSDKHYDEKDEKEKIPNDSRLFKLIQPRKVYVPFQKKRKVIRKRPSTPDSIENQPWIKEFSGVEEQECQNPHPSVVSSEDERETYIIGSEDETTEFENDGEDDNFEFNNTELMNILENKESEYTNDNNNEEINKISEENQAENVEIDNKYYY